MLRQSPVRPVCELINETLCDLSGSRVRIKLLKDRWRSATQIVDQRLSGAVFAFGALLAFQDRL